MDRERPIVDVTTELGSFALAVETERAPISSASFLAYVDGGYLDGSSVFRILTHANQPDVEVKVKTIQWGLAELDGHPLPLPYIEHEPTSITGLRQKAGTMSMARREGRVPGSEYFINIEDQPELEFGGRRNPDGLGFAAFAQIVEGFETVLKIFRERGEAEHYIKNRVRVISVRRR